MTTPSPNLLPAELAAIVHHVELHQAGWWDKAIQRLVLASVWLDRQNLSADEIRRNFESNFRLSLSSARIKSATEALESQGLLIRLPDDKFRIPDERRRIFENEIDEAEASSNAVKEYFFNLAEELLKDLNPDDVWAEFESVFLAPLIREAGANAYKFIAGDGMTVDGELSKKFQNKFDSAYKAQLLELVTRFLDPRNEVVSSYVSRMLHAAFCVEASGLPDSVIEKLSASVGKPIQFRVFVDTNFLFSILELHDNPSNLAATELGELIASLNSSNFKIKLYITSRTIDEARRSISSTKARLKGFPHGANFTNAVSQAGFSGLAARFVMERAKKSGKLSPDDWFDPYLDNFITLAREKDVEFFNLKLDNYATRQDVVDDIHNVFENEKRRGPRAKTFEVIQHDMILWHLVNDNRPSYVESPVDAKDWILTLDYRFIRFDERKRINGETNVPMCLHPTSLIQLLRFWVPRSAKFEEAILGSMSLPFLFQEFDTEAERTSLRILKGISRFENSDRIPGDTITRIMLNEGLRTRISSRANGDDEDVETELIRDALIEEMKTQTDAERKYTEELSEEIRDKDSKLSALATVTERKDEKIGELQARIAAEEEKAAEAENKIAKQGEQIQELTSRMKDQENAEAMKGARTKYYFLLSVVLVASGAAAWLVAGELQLIASTVGLDLTRVFVGLFVFIALHLLIEKWGRRRELMSQLWTFRQISRFRAWLWSIVIGFIMAVLASLAANSMQEESDEKVSPTEEVRENGPAKRSPVPD